MAKRVSFDDRFLNLQGEDVFYAIQNYSDVRKRKKMVKMAKRIIDNELTKTQHNFVCDYYFEGLNTVEIANKYQVTPQAVSAGISRGMKTIYRFMRYCLDCNRCPDDEEE